MNLTDQPLVAPIVTRTGWKRTEGFSGFPVPIQPHFQDEFPDLAIKEFNLLIGFQLWWINAPAFAREEMRMRQSIFGPAAWTRFRPATLSTDSTPEQFAAAIRMALHTAKPTEEQWKLDPVCFTVTAKTAEVSSTIADILSDMHAALSARIEEQHTRIRFIIEDRESNPMADANYREADLVAARRKIDKLTDQLHGKGGPNWITPFDQRFTSPESFK